LSRIRIEIIQAGWKSKYCESVLCIISDVLFQEFCIAAKETQINSILTVCFIWTNIYYFNITYLLGKYLRGSDCSKAQKIENPGNLPEEHLWGAIFENIT